MSKRALHPMSLDPDPTSSIDARVARRSLGHVSVDIETAALSPLAMVTSIGAVAFDPSEPEDRWDRWHVCISARDIENGQSDADTMMWWQQQSERARRDFTYSWSSPAALSLRTGLCQFEAFLAAQAPGSSVWTNPPSFDCSILNGHAQRLLNRDVIPHRRQRCFRTVSRLFSVPRESLTEDLVPHIALDDALAQARQLAAVMRTHPALAWGDRP